MERNAHLGINLLEAWRDDILDRYDKAVKETENDPVRTDHGIAAEAIFRQFLINLIPKRFGVTKGHILSPSMKQDVDVVRVSSINTLQIGVT